MVEREEEELEKEKRGKRLCLQLVWSDRIKFGSVIQPSKDSWVAGGDLTVDVYIPMTHASAKALHSDSASAGRQVSFFLEKGEAPLSVGSAH